MCCGCHGNEITFICWLLRLVKIKAKRFSQIDCWVVNVIAFIIDQSKVDFFPIAVVMALVCYAYVCLLFGVCKHTIVGLVLCVCDVQTQWVAGGKYIQCGEIVIAIKAVSFQQIITSPLWPLVIIFDHPIYAWGCPTSVRFHSPWRYVCLHVLTHLNTALVLYPSGYMSGLGNNGVTWTNP